MTLILFLIFLACFITGAGGCLRLQRRTDRVREALESAGRHPGLAREAAASGPRLFFSEPVFGGTLEGTRVTVGLAWRLIPWMHKIIGPTAQAAVFARFPTSLDYRLEISSRDGAVEPGPRFGDTLFDRRVKVWTDDEEAVRELLASPMRRRRVRRFIEKGRLGRAVVTGAGIVREIPDAHREWSNPIYPALLESARLARAVSRREQVRRGEAEPTPRETMEDLLIDRLEKMLPQFADLRIEAKGRVKPGNSPSIQAMRGKNETPKGFPRRSPAEKAPPSLQAVEVECDTGAFHDSRNTWYNYDGYCLTLWVFSETGEIWDARWEHTD